MVLGPYLAENGVEVRLFNPFNILPECFEGLQAVTYNPMLVVLAKFLPGDLLREDRLTACFRVSYHDKDPHFPKAGTIGHGPDARARLSWISRRKQLGCGARSHLRQ